jgi:hypothetical protein
MASEEQYRRYAAECLKLSCAVRDPGTESNGLNAAILDFHIGRQAVTPVALKLASRGVPFIFYTAQSATDTIRSEWPTCQIISKPAPSQDIVNAIAGLAVRGTSLWTGSPARDGYQMRLLAGGRDDEYAVEPGFLTFTAARSAVDLQDD